MLDEEQLAQLEHFGQVLEQGDVVHVKVLTTLGAPEATFNEETKDADEVADFRVTSVERRLPSGLWAIVTQTCDIRRAPDVEPFLHLSPLIEAASESLWNDLRAGGRSSRFYAYPVAFDTVDIDRPMLDIRIIQTIERAALVAETVDPMPLQFDPRERRRLSAWFSQRFGRHAFPDTLENEVLGPLRKACLARLGKSSEAGALLEVREGIFARYTDSLVEVVFVLSQARTLAHDRFTGAEAEIETKLKAGLDQIMKPVVKVAGRQDPGWTVTWKAVFPEGVPFSDFLYDLHPVALD